MLAKIAAKSGQIANLQQRNRLFSLIQGLLGVSSYFLVMQLVAQKYGVSGIGLWSLTMGFVAFVRLLDLSGASGLNRMVASESQDKKAQVKIIDSSFLFILLLFIPLLCIAYLIFPGYLIEIAVDYPEQLVKEVFILTLVSMLLNVAGVSQLGAVDGIGRADARSIINCISYFIFIFLAAILIDYHGLVGLAFAQIGQYTFALIAARIYLFHKIKILRLIPSRFSVKSLRQVVSYGLRLQLFSLPMLIFDPLVRLVLGRSVGLEGLGFYDLAYKFTGHTRAVLQAYLNPTIPQFTSMINRSREDGRRLLWDVQNKLSLPIALAFSTVTLLSPIMSLIILGEIYIDFLVYVSILSLAWGLITLMLPVNLFSRAANKLGPGILGQFCMLFFAASIFEVSTGESIAYREPIIVGVSLVIGNAIGLLGEMYYLWDGQRLSRNSMLIKSVLIAIFTMILSSVTLILGSSVLAEYYGIFKS